MKVKIFILSFLIFLLCKTEISAGWEYYENNPVLSPSADSWDSQAVNVPSVIYDENKFKMWYQGQQSNLLWSIGAAESYDGLTWSKSINTPQVTPFMEFTLMEVDIGQPSVVKNDMYRMWYTSSEGSNYHIRYATSIDGINWQKYPSYVLSGTEMWENRGVSNPFVIYKNNQYWMWYQAWGSGDWKIGFAQSLDGINWQKYPNNPLNLPSIGSVGGPGVVFWKDVYHMWYTTFFYANAQKVWHVVSPDGVNWQCQEECETFTVNPNHFNSAVNYTPRPVVKDNVLYLFFGGNDGLTSQIGLYRYFEDKQSIVILPGFFASWNKNAIIYNQAVSPSDWKLFSGVKEYDGLINTLKNLGYKNDQDLFVFPYDWRKSIDQTTVDLNNFLNQKVWSAKPSLKINLIGHSLGGLIARIWQQKYNSNSLNRIITLGSPHQGVVQAYKPLAAGELDRENTLMWLAEKLILLLNKSTIETDKVTLANKFPVLFDLLPTFNYLRDINNNEIPTINLTLQNNLLNSHNSGITNVFPYLSTFYGEKTPTLSGYKIEQRTAIDQVFDRYIDGRPSQNLFEIGDGTVIPRSANQGMDAYQFNLDHKELVTNKNAIAKILQLLQVNYMEQQIVEGTKTNISPSLIFLTKSPISLKVNFNDQSYTENDEGIIFVDNAQTGSYQLEVQGTDLGNYEIDIFQISENNELFESIQGEIKSSPPQTQTDHYSFDYNSQFALSALPTPTPTPSPTLIPTPTLTTNFPINTPTLIPTILPTAFTSSPTPNYQTITYQNTNNIIAPTIIINNDDQSSYPAPIKNDEKNVLGYTIEQKPNSCENIRNNETKLMPISEKNENSLNNLWRIIVILFAGGTTIYILYKKHKNINPSSS